MHYFWKLIVEPILKATTGGVVEIGAEEGINTRNLLRHCKIYQKELIVIDPAPGFGIKQLIDEEGYDFKMFEDESLNVLPTVKGMGAYLIDGDHNWYTVYNELKTIEKNYPSAEEFPILIFHDTHWPYARRDCYYDVNRIPKAYQNPYKKSGIKYQEKELSNVYRFNDHLDNAIEEGGSKNGVLTAIEDFMQESTLAFEWLNLAVYHGFGIMASKKHLQSSDTLQKCFNHFNSNSFLSDLIRELEQIRAIQFADIYNENKKLKEQLREQCSKKGNFFKR